MTGFANRMMFFKRKKPALQLSREEALNCIPVVGNAVRVSQTSTGLIRLGYPLMVKPWIADLARRFSGNAYQPPARQLELDELGTLTWDLINGQHSVKDIIQQFANQTKVHPKEAEAAVTRFLRELGRRGIIGMAPGNPKGRKGIA